MSGIKSNSSSQQILKQINQFTGLANLKVLAVNPNKDELQKLLPNAEIKDEPVYTGIVLQEGNPPVNKLVFHLGGTITAVDRTGAIIKENIITRLEFIVNSVERISKSGKNQWINKFGVLTWNNPEEIAANPKMAWANHPPFKKALVGEEEVLNFVKNWLNVDPKSECNFADSNKIMAGDVSELRGYLKDKPANEVTVYLDVTENGDKFYQRVYTKAFSRPTAKTPEAIFAKAFQEEYGAPKAPFKSFDLKVFYPNIAIDTPDAEDTASKRAGDFV